MTRTLAQLFDDFGGPVGVGKAVGKSTEHASTMKRRGSIPVRYWSRLLTAAHERGIDLDEAELIEIHADQRERA